MMAVPLRRIPASQQSRRSSPRIHGPQPARLEARFRAARDAASRRLRELADRAAQAKYDALIAAMALCAGREASPDAAELETRWSALTDLPPAWKSAMEARFKGTARPQPLGDTLLQLEAALNIDSPAELAAARRALKMQALKIAMENRAPMPASRP